MTEPTSLLSPLRREHGCARDLLWRCEVADEAVTGTLSLLREHSRPQNLGPSLGVDLFEVAGEHTIVLVRRTGRIQIRIHGLTPPSSRAEAAERVAAWLNDLVGRHHRES